MYHLLEIYLDVNLSILLSPELQDYQKSSLSKSVASVRLEQTEFLVEGQDILSIFNLHKVRLVGHEQLCCLNSTKSFSLYSITV